MKLQYSIPRHHPLEDFFFFFLEEHPLEDLVVLERLFYIFQHCFDLSARRDCFLIFKVYFLFKNFVLLILVITLLFVVDAIHVSLSGVVLWYA